MTVRTSDGEMATVGASARSARCSAASLRNTAASIVGSSHRMNDDAMPTRSCPCLRATSSIR
ncbi:Uncharacterised protein [Mycobacteroides abscessus subsp. abscessus]|nr:Uncharacterised protein [Mycobacteroides abscessus subsp. abscessus]